MDNDAKPPFRADFQARLEERGYQAGIELVTAVLILVVCLTPLRSWFTGPEFWALADISAGYLVFIALLGREDAFGFFYAFTVFGGIAFLALWLFADGLVLMPVLMIAYIVRAMYLAFRHGAKTIEGVMRVTAAMMLAGIPAMIIYSWGGSPFFTAALFNTLFFLGSAWFYLYPPLEWVNSYTPPGRGKSPGTPED